VVEVVYMKHLVVSDVKYCAGKPFFWTEVSFRSEEEIHELIDALKVLLSSHGPGHFHLSDVKLSPSGPASSSEIVFYSPAARRTNESEHQNAESEARQLLSETFRR
jgi:hypothetical protein